MKDLNLIVWLTQLGLSAALPLGGFVLLALWLRQRFGWGDWVIWVGILIGFVCAVDGFRSSLKTMSRMAKNKSEDEPPSVCFNDHD